MYAVYTILCGDGVREKICVHTCVFVSVWVRVLLAVFVFARTMSTESPVEPLTRGIRAHKSRTTSDDRRYARFASDGNVEL